MTSSSSSLGGTPPNSDPVSPQAATPANQAEPEALIETLKSQIIALETAKEKLQTSLDKSLLKIKALNLDVKEFGSEIDSLEQENKQFGADIAQLKDNLGKSAGENQKKTLEIGRLDKENKQLRTDIAKLNENSKKSADENQKKTLEIDRLKKKNTELASEIDRLDNVIRSFRGEISSLKIQVKDANYAASNRTANFTRIMQEKSVTVIEQANTINHLGKEKLKHKNNIETLWGKITQNQKNVTTKLLVVAILELAAAAILTFSNKILLLTGEISLIGTNLPLILVIVLISLSLALIYQMIYQKTESKNIEDLIQECQKPIPFEAEITEAPSPKPNNLLKQLVESSTPSNPFDDLASSHTKKSSNNPFEDSSTDSKEETTTYGSLFPANSDTVKNPTSTAVSITTPHFPLKYTPHSNT